MNGAFFIVGPTATGKSELAADVALRVDAEIVNGDAFQIYSGFDVLAAKPEASTLAKVPHHLIGTVSPAEEMNAQKFRSAACHAIDEIRSRGKLAIVVGGSGLYLKALTHGLSAMPAADVRMRSELDKLSMDELRVQLEELDPKGAAQIDLKNRRRVIRAIEVSLLTGRPASDQRSKWKTMEGGAPATPSVREPNPHAPGSQELAPPVKKAPNGVFVFRDREDLHRRINGRVEAMLNNGAIDEVAEAPAIGATTEKMIGIREIRRHLEGNLPIEKCVTAIQQATRQYAKRQLTWFRHQLSFEPLNLSLLNYNEAVEWVSRRALACRAEG